MSSNIEKIKIVFVGESNVGKTTLLNSMVRPNKKNNNYEAPTVGVAFTAYVVKHNNKTISLDLWDTAGQEAYRALAPLYFRGTMYCILVFDISKYSTFDKMGYWKSSCMDANRLNDTKFILVGNKSDLNIRNVSNDDINEYCYRNDIYTYIEISAYTGLNVTKILEVILQNYSPVESKPPPPLDIVPHTTLKKSECPC